MEILRIISLGILMIFILVFIMGYILSTEKEERIMFLVFMTIFVIPFAYIILN